MRWVADAGPSVAVESIEFGLTSPEMYVLDAVVSKLQLPVRG